MSSHIWPCLGARSSFILFRRAGRSVLSGSDFIIQTLQERLLFRLAELTLFVHQIGQEGIFIRLNGGCTGSRIIPFRRAGAFTLAFALSRSGCLGGFNLFVEILSQCGFLDFIEVISSVKNASSFVWAGTAVVLVPASFGLVVA
jgi:hypothetical protein